MVSKMLPWWSTSRLHALWRFCWTLKKTGKYLVQIFANSLSDIMFFSADQDPEVIDIKVNGTSSFWLLVVTFMVNHNKTNNLSLLDILC